MVLPISFFKHHKTINQRQGKINKTKESSIIIAVSIWRMNAKKKKKKKNRERERRKRNLIAIGIVNHSVTGSSPSSSFSLAPDINDGSLHI